MLCTHKTASSASLVLEICHQFNNSYLNQFSSISGGNCITYAPDFLFSRPPFTTPIRDLISRPPFATLIRDPISRPPFATHFRDSFLTTRIRNHTCDSRSRLPIAPPTATCYFLSRLPSCDSTTDRRTVLTPQRHLPSVPTLSLL